MLFEPVKAGTLELENRAMRSATWDSMADEKGRVTDESLGLFRELGRGRIGLIVTGHAYISDAGQASPYQYGIHTDEMIPGLSKLVKEAKREGSKIAVQISHAGINSLRRRQKLPVRVVSLRDDAEGLQEEMTSGDIEEIIEDFGLAAERAAEAGFDAVQLHGAHGYLLSQFLSPLYNLRTDEWGGPVEDRQRMHLEVIRRVRKAVGSSFPLFIKFGIQEEKENGLTLGEGIGTAREMVGAGIDMIEVSGGDAGSSIPLGAKDGKETVVFRERTAALKKEIEIPVALVSGIRSPETAEDILSGGDADIISMCRPFIREPLLLDRWRKGDPEKATCISCNKCLGRGNRLSCAEEEKLKGK